MKYNMKTNELNGTPDEIKQFLKLKVVTQPAKPTPKRQYQKKSRNFQRYTEEETNLIKALAKRSDVKNVEIRRLAKQLNRKVNAIKMQIHLQKR